MEGVSPGHIPLQGLAFRDLGLGVWYQRLMLRVWGLRFRVWDLGLGLRGVPF